MSTNAASPVPQRIVVGSDGSEGARKAIVWAIMHASPADSIEIVHGWSLPVSAAEEAGISLDPSLFEAGAKKSLQSDFDFVAAEYPEYTNVTGRTELGHSGSLLSEAAGDADMLVVGTRGHGGFVGLLLGSTSAYLAHHAPCPLVIVPDNSDD